MPFLLCESAENGRVFRSSFSFACAGWREASRVGRVSVGRDAWAQQPNLAHRIILEAPRTPTPPETRARPRPRSLLGQKAETWPQRVDSSVCT